jgi:hypothetical protein
VRSITLDSNIYVSALEFGGKPMALLQSALDGEVDVAISQAILDEILRVLRDKFSWSRDDLRGAEAAIRAAAHVVTPAMKLNVVESDKPRSRRNNHRQLKLRITHARFRDLERPSDANSPVFSASHTLITTGMERLVYSLRF